MRNKSNNIWSNTLIALTLLALPLSFAFAYQGAGMYRNATETQRNMFARMINDPNLEDIDFGFAGDRLEVDISYDYLDPNETYGDWTALNFSYYDKISNSLTILYQGSAITRIEGEGLLGAIGAYKGWAERFYTFTQVSAGSDSEYLPALRLDQEFNYLFGEKKNIVGLLGFTYINQHDAHEVYTGSIGVTYYAADYNIGYRAFFHQNNPGSIYSNSHILSLGVGHEKDQWVYIDLAYGNPAYLSLVTPDYQEVQNDTLGISVKYRKWLNENSGFYAETGFFNLEGGYQKYNFRIGYFKEF